MNDFCFICNSIDNDVLSELVIKKQVVLNGQIIKTNEMYYKVCDCCKKHLLDKPNRLDKLFKK